MEEKHIFSILVQNQDRITQLSNNLGVPLTLESVNLKNLFQSNLLKQRSEYYQKTDLQFLSYNRIH